MLSRINYLTSVKKVFKEVQKIFKIKIRLDVHGDSCKTAMNVTSINEYISLSTELQKNTLR